MHSSGPVWRGLLLQRCSCTQDVLPLGICRVHLFKVGGREIASPSKCTTERSRYIRVLFFFLLPTQGFLKAFQISQRDILTFTGCWSFFLFFLLKFGIYTYLLWKGTTGSLSQYDWTNQNTVRMRRQRPSRVLFGTSYFRLAFASFS